ncbi:DNA polymerase I [Stenotrophomonas phage vB_SmeS_BUCT700]|uniref:DNA polymerase n=1 Tax=Stenotrophomonas phage vB_SmeS_BUCT700 TaxID=2924895 RepID=A0AAE9K6X0_9CAUD|nr:DNA polymerase I [Stenotrophomonas phage vB_SmeS_BUCT700]UNY50293.1 DNA polymerase I [Stenotrophomonas phage vB_SmeS_BUCT703]
MSIVIKPMQERGFLAWDLETGIKKALRRGATPFYNENIYWAVGFGTGVNDRVGFHRKVDGIPDGWFPDMLNQCKLLVGFNIKFDLLYALQDPVNHAAWMKWVADGGQVWDCQLVEYLLQGMDTPWQMCSMDEVAPLYGGSMKDSAVKACWNNGIDTPDIDPDMLMDYLLGTGEDNLGDIGNTALIFKGQFKLATERGQLKSCLLNNGALIYTVECELNGMKIARELGEKLRIELSEKLEVVSAKVNEHLPKDLPFEFNWGSPAQKSALFFGGTIKYEQREHKCDWYEQAAKAVKDGELSADEVPEHHCTDACRKLYAQKDVLSYILKDGTLRTEAEMTDADWLVVERFAGGQKKGMPKTKKSKADDHDRPKTHTVDRFYTFPGYVTPLPQWEGKTKGQYGTGSEIIKEMGGWVDAPPFVKDFAEQSKLSKDLSTYYWVIDEKTGEKKGMLSLLGPDDVIHHSLNMVNTNTARLSSSDPNLQNIPKGDKSDVKTVFISRFPGGSIVQSDFTALEVYVQGNLSLDKNLLSDLRSGMDMHCKRVSQKEGVPYEYVVERAKNKDHPEYKEWSFKRTKAKEFSFQRAYGAGAAAIAASTGMSVEDVKALIAAEEEMYPGVIRFNERTMKQLHNNRRPSKVHLPHDITRQVVNFGKSWFKTPDGKRYTVWESCAPKWLFERDGTLLSFKPTVVQNYPVQGTGGEWAKAAMWLLVRAFYEMRNFDGKSLLVNQVHDAVYTDTHPDVLVKSMALTHACMEEASVLMEQHFDWPIAVPVPTETVYGSSMAEELAAPEEMWKYVPLYRKVVRQKYLKNHTPSFEKE